MSAPAWAAEYIGIPFAEKGRTRAGVDCWGTVRLILDERFGCHELPDFGDAYSSTADRDGIAAAVSVGLLRGWERVHTPSEGVLVILRLAGRPWHCAIMLDAVHMLHALVGVGTIAERIDSMLWRNRIEGYYKPCHLS